MNSLLTLLSFLAVIELANLKLVSGFVGKATIVACAGSGVVFSLMPSWISLSETVQGGIITVLILIVRLCIGIELTSRRADSVVIRSGRLGEQSDTPSKTSEG